VEEAAKGSDVAMMDGVYAAISGLEANQTMLDVTANDLANTNTVGYKGASVTFSDALTQITRGAAGPTATLGGTNPIQVGLGVQVSAIDPNMGSGTLQPTGNPLDVAIEGNGFLRVGNGTPPATAPYTSGVPTTMDYTRAGNLTTDAAGFLTTQDGQYVIGRNAVATGSGASTTYSPGTTDTYLNIPTGSDNISIGTDGSVNYTDENPSSSTYGSTVTAGYLSLATFANQDGLQRIGTSDWTATQNSGAEKVGTPGIAGYGQTIGGQLEQSNVDLAADMSQMINAQNGYDANSRVIQTADAMLQSLMAAIQ
jgi:flagellar hook protein FlgE